jgi:endonuclease YncB( thermonuclease family)
MPRHVDWLLAVVALAALAAVATRLKSPSEILAGQTRVIDGDTLELGGRRLRLAGIDAPELDQSCERGGGPYRCGEVAREALRNLARAGVSCAISGQDRYGRGLATCTADGLDVGQRLVRAGLAVAYGRYEADERHAASLGLGLWAGRFERPADWRKAHQR